MRVNKIKRVKVPTVYQMEATECGAASLCMILKFFGKNISLEKVRLACGVSRDGSNALNLLRAGKSYDLKTKAHKKSLQSLTQTVPPMIIHWNFSHFVVYEGCNEKYIFINDPASGRKNVLYEEAEKSFTGISLSFEPGDKFEKTRDKNGILRFIYNNTKNEHKSITYLVLIGLCLIIPGLVIPVFSSVFIDEVLLLQHNELFGLIVGGMLITVFFQCILTFSQQYFLNRLQNKMVLMSSWKFIDHILKLPIEFFNQRDSSDISNRIFNNEEISNFLSGELAVNILNCVTSSFYLTLMVIYNPKLTVIVLLLMLSEFLLLKLLSPLIEDKNIMLQQETGKLTGSIVNGISSIDSLKAAGIENEYTSKIYSHQANCLEKEQDTGVISRLLNALTGFSSKLMSILILFIGGIDVINGNMSTGSLIAFNILVANFLAPVHELTRFGTRIQGVKASINRVNDILNYEVDKQFSTDCFKKDMHSAKLNGKVEVKNLQFGYNSLDAPLIDGISFEINPGKSIAIVGSSGSGKSTISKLVAGLYHPWSGEILFDGISKDHIAEEILCSSIAMVSQELVFFSGTISENITLSDNTITDSQIINAAKDACIHDVITTRREGYEHKMAEGGRNFSGGQLQRIEIARTLAKNPTIMILDEATSALDPVTEVNIINNIKRRGCTLIIIAHRLSTIRNCDEIILLDNGAIIQRGTHEGLKNVQGSYADLLRLN